MFKKVNFIRKALLRPRRRVYKGLTLLAAFIIYVLIRNTRESVSELNKISSLFTSSKTTVENNNETSVKLEDNKTHNLEIYKEKDYRQNFDNNKYILLWTPKKTPLNKLPYRGRLPFTINGCEYSNCFLTHRRGYFEDETHFDAVIFAISALKNLRKLPKKRSPRQKFVVASIEPPHIYPVINPLFDGFFNWTWTYKLNSDVLWRPFLIHKYETDEILGPQKNMKWLTELQYKPISPVIEEHLSLKNKAVVWIFSDCRKQSESFQYFMRLKKELLQYGLSITVYSNCTGYKSCGTKDECKNTILSNFYFYLAFEDYVAEDYVSETLMFSVHCLAVPVVLGGANYSRFLPPGSYLDANKLNAKQIASVIDQNMENFTLFQQYFRWVAHYYYEPISYDSEICNLCAALNDQEKVNNVTIYKDFRKYWNIESVNLISDFLFHAFENDEKLQYMLMNKNYSEIKKIFKKKYFPDPKDSVFVFDMDSLNITATEGTDMIMPAELTETSVSV